MALKDIKSIIAIASGKGGVGKSTVTANLAMAVALEGKSVGILDADLYGPSMGIMFDLKDAPEMDEKRHIIPTFSHGVHVVTLAQLFPAEKANAWRGPRAAALINNLLNFVNWGDMDILFIDLPPGTGDVQLSIVQNCKLHGVIMVCTPQSVALADCLKGIDLFREMNVPIIGLVENMSGFVCDGCSKEHFIFGKDGAKTFAQKMGLELLGQIPIDAPLMEGGEKGMPAVLANPNCAGARIFGEMATKLLTT
ncbi:MAG: Mrp/NBP35 family ATP-binding protein [Fibromonadales bacterium]|nr:Mrp/NBP35 family ATP-binding protein [Fibromonadales bacterium]